ncbi:hypothetical protein KW076_12075 [Micrococcus porci]|uniref:hypothetical protein n=1 Tax=Micrococcus porci TaxID=2856555 RepID=UPI001CCF68FB|nr:hypothetical protein [Micrococcus porci]UBH24564.1 hypothetical protein KW076_12075 [Micrococcus porci]
MPQSTLYWIIGIIIVVLVIILIVSSLRAKRGREEEAAAAGRHADSAPAPLAATAARGGTVGASTVPATGDAPADRTDGRAAGATALPSFDVDEVDRRAAEQREQDVVERRRATGAEAGAAGHAAVPGVTGGSGVSVDEAEGVAKDATGQDVTPVADAQRRNGSSAAPAATGAGLGLAAAGVAGGTGVTVDDAGTGADLPAPKGSPAGVVEVAETQAEAAQADAAPAEHTVVPGVAGGDAVTVDTADVQSSSAPQGAQAAAGRSDLTDAEARTYPVTGLPGVPSAVDPEQVAAARVQDAAELKAAEGQGAEHERGASQPADPESVPGTVPLTGEEAVIEAPVHTHEMPEPVLGTPAYIQDSTTGQDPTEDLPEGQVYGTTPLSGEDAIVEPADQLPAEAAETEDRAASDAGTASAETAVVPVEETETAVVPVAETRSADAGPSEDSVALTGQGVETADRVEPAAPVAGTPARDEARTHDEHRSRLEIVKDAVAETAGTVATTAGTAAEKAAPVVRSAARTVGKAAGSAASTLKDKLAQAQERRWGKR